MNIEEIKKEFFKKFAVSNNGSGTGWWCYVPYPNRGEEDADLTKVWEWIEKLLKDHHS